MKGYESLAWKAAASSPKQGADSFLLLAAVLRLVT